MTNPGDSDEWWKQYGGEGVTPETPPAAPQQPAPPQPSVPQQPVPPPAGYTSAPQYQNPPMTPPPQPVYPNYPPPQANPVPGYPVAGQPQVGGMQPQMGGMQPRVTAIRVISPTATRRFSRTIRWPSPRW